MNQKILNTMKLDITKTIGDTEIRNVQYSELDKKQGRLVSYDRLTNPYNLIIVADSVIQ